VFNTPAAEAVRGDREAEMARCLEQGLESLPPVGAEFLGFYLLAELGRGAFSRVYLARQADLAHRPVALKVSPVFGEPQLLAQLQHTNIVPIYSVHADGPLQAVCMPYFGPTTLADVLKDLRGRGAPPESAQGLAHLLLPTVLQDVGSSPGKAPCESPTNGRPAPVKGLAGMSYVQAVLSLVARLADGLAHAHQHGILHRDLKPANVLLADDGEPMLLDFNLSEDVKRRGLGEVAPLGGTLSYMPPEVLDGMIRDEPLPGDARSDLYSLGVILYELLAGRLPTPVPEGPPSDGVRRLLADRRRPPPPLRPWNREVSPAVESIVRHCLHPDPDKRYQTAAQLREDLQRQLENLPLRHAQEPSLREQARKWARRHPKLASPVTLGALLAMAVATWAWVAWQNSRVAAAERQALAQLKQFQQEAEPLLQVMATRNLVPLRTDNVLIPPEDISATARDCNRVLQRHRVLDDSDWTAQPAVRDLPEVERTQLRREVSEILYLMGVSAELELAQLAERASAARAVRTALRFLTPLPTGWVDAVIVQRAQAALELNRHAEAALKLDRRAEGSDPPAPPQSLLFQRAALTRFLGHGEEAKGLFARAWKTAPSDARDFYRAACERAAEGRFEVARDQVEKAAQLAPRHFGAWLLKAVYHHDRSHYPEADFCYSVCLLLRPDFKQGYLLRGDIRMRQKQWALARENYDQMLVPEHWPNLVEAHIQRARALAQLQQDDIAIGLLTEAIEQRGLETTGLYYLRAELLSNRGREDEAKLDYEWVLQNKPRGERAWLYRALARPKDQSAEALTELDRFLKEEPDSPHALQALLEKARRLETPLNQPEQALQVLDRLVKLYPNSPEVRIQGAILRARLGKPNERRLAQREAEKAFRQDQSPQMHYRVAVVYALTLRSNPGNMDANRALKMLAYALGRGYRERREGQTVEPAADPDLSALRMQPEFACLIGFQPLSAMVLGRELRTQSEFASLIAAARRLRQEPAPRMRLD
jgi:serine/threonine protein kinase